MMKKEKTVQTNDYFEAPKEKLISPPRDHIKKLKERLRRGSMESITFEQWKDTLGSIFPELTVPAEIGLSVLAQLLIEDISNPFGLVYLDVPASGKTIILNLLSGLEELVYTLDNFSPASFVSHAANKASEALEEIDLLPKIVDRSLVVRDLAPLFGQRADDLLRSIGILTRVFDGEGLETASGVHGKRGYRGRYLFMMLGASTPIPPHIWRLMGSLGSRLFFLNVGSKEKSNEDLANQVMGASWKEQEEKCRVETKKFLVGLVLQGPIKWDRGDDDPALVQEIAQTSKMLARLRGTISIWGDGDAKDTLTHSVPIIEKPDRITQLLYNLARGHALINGRRHLDESDLEIVLKVALDSGPYHRSKLFKKTVGSSRPVLTSEDVEQFLNCSRPTALKEMEALAALRLVQKKQHFIEGEFGEAGVWITTISLAWDLLSWLERARSRFPHLFRV